MQVELVPMGKLLFFGESVSNEHGFCLYECLMNHKKGENITFTDSSVEKQLDIRTLIPYEGKSSLMTFHFHGNYIIENNFITG